MGFIAAQPNIAMKLFLTVPAALLMLVSLAQAQSPLLQVYTDEYSYLSGDICYMTIKLDTYGRLSQGEVSVELTDRNGALADGVIFHTSVPEKFVQNSGRKETVMEVINEGVQYNSPEKTIYRTVDFRIPADLEPGIYNVGVMFFAPEGRLSAGSRIEVASGDGSGMGIVLAIYIFLIIYTVYTLRRG